MADNNSIGQRILRGWGKFLSGGRGNTSDRLTAEKLLSHHVYTSDELSKLGKDKTKMTLIDQLALQKSEMARREIQGNPGIVDKTMPLPDVEYENGSFSVVINDEKRQSSLQERVHNLELIRDKYNISLPEEQSALIDEQTCKEYAGKYYRNIDTGNVLRVAGYDDLGEYRDMTTNPHRFGLVLDNYDTMGNVVKSELHVDVDTLQKAITLHKVSVMTDKAVEDFQKQSSIVRASGEKFEALVGRMVVNHKYGTLEKSQGVKFNTSENEGKGFAYTASGWTLLQDNGPSTSLRLFSNELRTNGKPVGVDITKYNAYQFGPQLNTIEETLFSNVDQIRGIAQKAMPVVYGASSAPKEGEGLIFGTKLLPDNKPLSIDGKKYYQFRVTFFGDIFAADFRRESSDKGKTFIMDSKDRARLLSAMRTRLYDIIATNTVEAVPGKYVQSKDVETLTKALGNSFNQSQFNEAMRRREVNDSDYYTAYPLLNALLEKTLPDKGMKQDLDGHVMIYDNGVYTGEFATVANTGNGYTLLPKYRTSNKTEKELLNDGKEVESLSKESRLLLCERLLWTEIHKSLDSLNLDNWKPGRIQLSPLGDKYAVIDHATFDDSLASSKSNVLKFSGHYEDAYGRHLGGTLEPYLTSFTGYALDNLLSSAKNYSTEEKARMDIEQHEQEEREREEREKAKKQEAAKLEKETLKKDGIRLEKTLKNIFVGDVMELTFAYEHQPLMTTTDWVTGAPTPEYVESIKKEGNTYTIVTTDGMGGEISEPYTLHQALGLGEGNFAGRLADSLSDQDNFTIETVKAKEEDKLDVVVEAPEQQSNESLENKDAAETEEVHVATPLEKTLLLDLMSKYGLHFEVDKSNAGWVVGVLDSSNKPLADLPDVYELSKEDRQALFVDNSVDKDDLGCYYLSNLIVDYSKYHFVINENKQAEGEKENENVDNKNEEDNIDNEASKEDNQNEQQSEQKNDEKAELSSEAGQGIQQGDKDNLRDSSENIPEASGLVNKEDTAESQQPVNNANQEEKENQEDGKKSVESSARDNQTNDNDNSVTDSWQESRNKLFAKLGEMLPNPGDTIQSEVGDLKVISALGVLEFKGGDMNDLMSITNEDGTYKAVYLKEVITENEDGSKQSELQPEEINLQDTSITASSFESLYNKLSKQDATYVITNQESENAWKQAEDELDKIEPIEDDHLASHGWHTDEMQVKEAWHTYSSILIGRMNMQLANESLPWVSVKTTIPRTLDGKEFEGISALMLGMQTEKEGFSMPVYMTKEEVKDNGLSLNSLAYGFPVIENDEKVRYYYNIDQTDFRIKEPVKYSEMSEENAAEAKVHSGNALNLSNLVRNGEWVVPSIIDYNTDKSYYSFGEKRVHILPYERYENRDDYYRDLVKSLVSSVREKPSDGVRIDGLIGLSFIDNLGVAMVSQKYRFNALDVDQSNQWREKIRFSPEYTRTVLKSAEMSSRKIYKHLNEKMSVDNVKQDDSPSLDYQSTTGSVVDADGNGIVDDQENLAPDSKHDDDEKKKEEVHHSSLHR